MDHHAQLALMDVDVVDLLPEAHHSTAVAQLLDARSTSVADDWFCSHSGVSVVMCLRAARFGSATMRLRLGTTARINRGAPRSSLDMIVTPSDTAASSALLGVRVGRGAGGGDEEHAANAKALAAAIVDVERIGAFMMFGGHTGAP